MTKGEPYTLTQEQADYTNVSVLGKFLEKYPDCEPVKAEYKAAKARIDHSRKRRKVHVLGTKQCPNRHKGQTHFAIQDSVSPTYHCLYCCANMS
jgi:hypothetical protein